MKKASTQTIILAISLPLMLFIILSLLLKLNNCQREIYKLIELGRAVDAVVARKDIYEGTTITRDMVRVIVAEKSSMRPGDITSLASAIGKIAEEDIFEEMHINKSMLSLPENNP